MKPNQAKILMLLSSPAFPEKMSSAEGLAHRLQIGTSTCYQHISLLMSLGFIVRNKRGRKTYYRARDRQQARQAALKALALEV